jgi:hypothetical protein
MLITSDRSHEKFFKDLVTIRSLGSPFNYDQEYILEPTNNYESNKNSLFENKKILFPIDSSPYHFMIDTVALILYLNEKHKNSIFYFDTFKIKDRFLSEKQYDFLTNLLEKNKIKYRFVDTKNTISLSNVILISVPFFEPMEKIKSLYNNLKENNYLSGSAPHKKVYVSRTNSGSVYGKDIPRLKDEKLLENLFAKLGFEIIYAEDFKKKEDQIYFFSQVKILAGVSGSNLHNSLFMQPGTTVLELFALHPNNPNMEASGMRFDPVYQIMSLIRGLLHLSFYSEDAQGFVENIEKDFILNKILQ